MTQVALLVLITTLIVGVVTYFFQKNRSAYSVRATLETVGHQVSEDVKNSIEEYPAAGWLLSYWMSHADELDIEYDADYETGTRTLEKLSLLHEHCPDLQLKYATEAQLAALDEQDRKLAAEICYSWLQTRVNQIKRSFDVDYLFCVVTDADYATQFFLLSAAEPGSVRGTEYEQVYPLGTLVQLSKEQSQPEAMKSAAKASSHLAEAGDYVDYYEYLCDVDGRQAFVGMTYNLSAVNDKVHAQTLLGTLNAVSLQLLLSVVCFMLMLVFIIRPIKKVQHAISRYTGDKDSAAVEQNLKSLTPRRSEIGHLSRGVVRLTGEIDDYVGRIEAITAERQRIDTELSLAGHIQADMLPSDFPAFPNRKEIDIYACMDPAKEVGGDFYDFYFTDDDHLALVIADVSGKGIPAALLMMACRIMLKDMLFGGHTPAGALEICNRALCARNREDMFVTAWIGVLELSTGILTAANAGHEYPVIKQPSGKFELYKDVHGFVLGGLEDISYTDYQIRLEKGAKLFVYTDGVPEATDGEKRLFGVDAMLQSLNEAADEPPENILKRVKSDVEAFVGDAPQFDDLTELCVEYKGSGSTAR